jgi:S-adenosylmethionine/arginine decarboxylase-like enzyme
MHGLDHFHLLVTAYVSNSPADAEAGEKWLRKLVEIIDMEILMDAKAVYCEDLGNEGLTGIVGLTTSHASMHFWPNASDPFVSFDLYSCRHFSTEAVFDHLKEWGMTKCSYMLVNRHPDLAKMEIVEQGVFTPE